MNGEEDDVHDARDDLLNSGFSISSDLFRAGQLRKLDTFFTMQ